MSKRLHVLHTTKAEAHDGVLELRFPRPPLTQSLRIGQYCYLNFPDVHTFKWNPFTVTSSPHEQLWEVCSCPALAKLLPTRHRDAAVCMMLHTCSAATASHARTPSRRDARFDGVRARYVHALPAYAHSAFLCAVREARLERLN